MASVKEIGIKINADAKQAKAAFDGLDVSAKELQERIAYLDAVMQKQISTFGKAASSTKAYDIVQRERKVALDQLIAMEEKQIEVANRSTRGLGSLSSAALSASGSISGLGTGVSTLTTALMSGVGLTAGLAAAVAGFALLMDYIRSTNEEFERLKGQVSGLLEIQGPGGSFKVDPEKLPQIIERVKQQIKDLSDDSKYPGGFFGVGNRERTKNYKAILETLEEANKKYQEQKSIIEDLTKVGLVYTEEIKNQLDVLKERNNIILDFLEKQKLYEAEPLGDYVFPGTPGPRTPQEANLAFMQSVNGYRMSRRESQMRALQDAWKEEERMMRDREREMNKWILSSSSVLRSEFGSAWEDIFGEANSLFEKFAQTWSQMLVDKISTNLFSLAFGGIF